MVRLSVSNPDPIEIVIHWFVVDIKGGAQRLGRLISDRMAARCHQIEVLPTVVGI